MLPDDVVSDFEQRFAWLRQVTGPTRDLDVFLLELPLPGQPAGRDGRMIWISWRSICGRLRVAQQKLKRELGSVQMRALLDDWHAVLDADEPPGEPGWFADLPVERVAGRRIWRMGKVLKDGRAVFSIGHAEDMHALRKDCRNCAI